MGFFFFGKPKQLLSIRAYRNLDWHAGLAKSAQGSRGEGRAATAERERERSVLRIAQVEEHVLTSLHEQTTTQPPQRNVKEAFCY